MLVKSLYFIGMREGEEPKASRHASAVATRNDRLPYSQQGLYPNFLVAFPYLGLRA